MRIGKDAVSRVARRLEEELSAWRGRPLELAYPYLYLDAAYFKANWAGGWWTWPFWWRWG